MELDEDVIREGEIRHTLDQFFGYEGDNSELGTALRISEGLGSSKSFSRIAAERADEFYEDNVFILLGEDQGELEVVAYADEKDGIVELGGYWESYQDIITPRENDLDLEGLDIFHDLPAPFKEDRYRLPVDTDYIKIRKGGVIGPGTEEYHNEYGQFEPEPRI